LALKTLLIFVDVLVILVFKNLQLEFNDYEKGDRVIVKTTDYERPVALAAKRSDETGNIYSNPPEPNPKNDATVTLPEGDDSEYATLN
jgi:hypothetical protein